MKRVTKIITSLLVLGLFGVGVSACAPPKPSIENADKLAEKVVNKIGRKHKLDGVQKAHLSEMYEDFKRNRALRADYVALIDGWIEQVERPEMDQAAILELMRRKHTLDMRSEPRISTQLTELHATLNDDQKNRVVKKLNEARAWIGLGLDK